MITQLSFISKYKTYVRTTSAWLFIVFTAFSITSCQKNSSNSIDVGLIVDIQTPGGLPAKNAALMFERFINENGGIDINQRKRPLKLHIEEIGINPDDASQAARKLIYKKNVVAIIGPNLSSAAVAAGTIAEVAGVPLISPGSTSPEVSDNKRFVVQLAFSDELQGQQISRYLTEEMNQKSAAIIYEISNPSSRRVAEAFTRQFNLDGGELLLSHAYTRDSAAINPILDQVTELSAPVLVLPNRHNHIQQHADYLRSKQYQGVLFGSDTWSPTKLKENPHFDGSLMTHHWHHSMSRSHKLSNQFVDYYVRQYADSPTSMSALTYDALSLLVKATSKSYSQKTNLIDEIKSTNSISGITGMIGTSEEVSQTRVPIIIKLLNKKSVVIQ